MSDSVPADAGLSARQLAGLLGGELLGNGDFRITRVAPLDEADSSCLSWLGDARYLRQLATTRAGVVLLPLDTSPPHGKTAVRVADPDFAMCAVLRALSPPPPDVPLGIHPSAIIEEGARVDGAAVGPHAFVGRGAIIGARTQLHFGAYVGEQSRIGADCVLWPGAVVRERCTIGNRVIIHPAATIGADGFGYLQRQGQHVKIPQVGSVVIEDDVEIGAGSCIDRARSGATMIGAGTKIDNLVQIGHNVRLGPGCLIVAQCGISGSTSLGRYVVLGGQVGIIDHLSLGDGAQVAAASAVFNDLPGGRTYRGIPAVERVAFGRELLSLRRLPDLLRRIRELEERISELESAKDHPA